MGGQTGRQAGRPRNGRGSRGSKKIETLAQHAETNRCCCCCCTDSPIFLDNSDVGRLCTATATRAANTLTAHTAAPVKQIVFMRNNTTGWLCCCPAVSSQQNHARGVLGVNTYVHVCTHCYFKTHTLASGSSALRFVPVVFCFCGGPSTLPNTASLKASYQDTGSNSSSSSMCA